MPAGRGWGVAARRGARTWCSLAARRRGTGPGARSRRRCRRRRIASVLEPRVTVALASRAPSSGGGSLMPRSL